MANTILRTFVSRYRQFGGWKVVMAYAKMGALWPMMRTIIRHPFERKTYRKAYSEALQKVEPLLMTKYTPVMLKQKEFYAGLELEHKRSKIVWFCWLQGLEHAPLVVKVCYASLKNHLSDRVIKMIDGLNWKDHVELPAYIVQKWEKKQIPPALFSDMLRLQLLIKYGGSWIDSTVLCTGYTTQNEKDARSYLDADLFVFQYARPGFSEWSGISNWFITSCTNNEVLLVLRDMLFAYWKKYDYLLDYYIFHLFFNMLREEYPEEIAAMPYGYSPWSLALMFNMDKPFKQEKWDRHTSRVCFHKLAYSIKRSTLEGKGNYYHHIVDGFSED